MALNQQPPYWEICSLSPFNDHFRVMYLDYGEGGKVQIGKIMFKDGKFEWEEGIHWEIKEDDTVQRFLDSLEWCTYFFSDPSTQLMKILEFHIAASDRVSDWVRVYWEDENDGWQSESWEFCREDGFIEIVPPWAASSFDTKRFSVSSTPLSTILSWLLEDIRKVTGGKSYALWIDLGNR